MDIAEFINYWDGVIAQWLEDKTIEKDQAPFFDGNKLALQRDYMPEPYWGNPCECSMVVVNYNPAGGDDHNPFTYWPCQDNPCTLVNFVKKYSYSELALTFPLLSDNLESVKVKGLEHDMRFLLSYPGRKWWMRQNLWIERLTNFSQKPTSKNPFVIELCGWHSEGWKGTVELLQEPSLKNSIVAHVINPMYDAIMQSDTRLGICIGKQFGEILSSVAGFEDITKEIGQSKFPHLVYDSEKGLRPIKEKERYYGIYRKGDTHIINTWSVGSNHHPSEEFSVFERLLIQLIGENQHSNC